MYYSTFKLFSITTLILIFSCSSKTYIAPAGTTWKKLGSKQVSYQLDKDEIRVGADEGRFNQLRIAVRKAPLNFHRCVVHFGNGDIQKIDLKKNFKKGTTSKTHQLNGGNRIINKVVLVYDTKNPARQRAIVDVWARQ